jgi:uncharacterized membrane protein required for colicin V production
MLADPATVSRRAEAGAEEWRDSEEYRQRSLRASRGSRIDVLAVLVAGVATLMIATLIRPVPSVPWSKYRVSDVSEVRPPAQRPLAIDPPAGIPADARLATPAPESALPQAVDLPKPEPARAILPMPARATTGFDLIVLAIVALATARGVVIGMLREAISIAVLGTAVIAVRVWNAPFANWLQSPTGASVRYDAAPWLAGALLAIAVTAAVATFAHVMRKDVRALARNSLDRVGGGTLGVVEGVIVAGLAVFVVGAWLGRSHALLAPSRSLALLERTEQLSGAPASAAPDVAAPPRPR